MTLRAVVAGCGHYLPERVVENSEFEKTLETSDEWIRSRSGIERRHFAAAGETTSMMSEHAARAALSDAGLVPEDLDALIVATSTPDLTFPSSATMVQSALGMTRGFAFDVQAVCAGFIYALANANALILSGQAERVMVIGAETFSKILDWSDRSTCVLFGDGAGAVILEAKTGTGNVQDRGILATDLNSDGTSRISCTSMAASRPTRPAICGWRARKSSATLSRARPDRDDLARQGRADGFGCRLGRAAPGQYPHHHRHGEKARTADGKRHRHRAGSRQYLCRLDPAGAFGWQGAWAAQSRRSDRHRSHRRRPRVGLRCSALVAA